MAQNQCLSCWVALVTCFCSILKASLRHMRAKERSAYVFSFSPCVCPAQESFGKLTVSKITNIGEFLFLKILQLSLAEVSWTDKISS